MGTTTTGYTLIKASTPFINGTALWHIIVVSVAAGAGLAVAFGLILLGLKYGQVGKDSAAKASGWVLGVLAAAFCVGAIVVGIYAMLHPSKSKPLKVVPSSSSSSALVVSHHTTSG